MPKIRKQRVKDPPAHHECKYCKNHPEENDLPVALKGHIPCVKYNNAEHFLECTKCLKNHKMTDNTRKWRENQISRNQNGK